MGKASEKARELYSTRVPASAKKITDKVARRAATWGKDSQSRGKTWATEQRKRLHI